MTDLFHYDMEPWICNLLGFYLELISYSLASSDEPLILSKPDDFKNFRLSFLLLRLSDLSLGLSPFPANFAIIPDRFIQISKYCSYLYQFLNYLRSLFLKPSKQFFFALRDFYIFEKQWTSIFNYLFKLNCESFITLKTYKQAFLLLCFHKRGHPDKQTHRRPTDS